MKNEDRKKEDRKIEKRKKEKREKREKRRDTMYLEIEELEEIFKMFQGRENDITVFVGQVNARSETDMQMSATVTIRYTGYEDSTIIRYTDIVGTAKIPQEEFAEMNETKPIFEKQEKEFNELEEKVQKRKKELEDMFLEKGYTVYKGVWIGEH